MLAGLGIGSLLAIILAPRLGAAEVAMSADRMGRRPAS